MNSFARPVQGVYAVSEGNGTYIVRYVRDCLPVLCICASTATAISLIMNGATNSSDICMQVARNILLTRFTRFNAAGVGGDEVELSWTATPK